MDSSIIHLGHLLALTVLAAARQTAGTPFQRGMDWLMGSEGVEGSWFNRVTARLGLVDPERDISYRLAVARRNVLMG